MTTPVSKALLTNWPTLKKLAPIKGGRVNTRNLVYMAEIALLTRLAVGVARISQSRPSKQTDPNLTQQEKKKAFYERFFMEIVGTGSYVAFLHFGNDLFANAMELFHANKIPQLHKSLQKKLSAYEYQKFAETFGKMFNDSTTGMVDTVLNGKSSHIGNEISRPTLDYFEQNLGSGLYKKVQSELKPFIKKTANRSAFISILGGALLGAYVGGNVIQKFNDKVFSPFLSRLMEGSQGATGNQGFQPYMDRPQAFNTLPPQNMDGGRN